VAAEAQAAGATVIASTCGGLPEAVAPANRRWSFPEGDVAALADRLFEVLGGSADDGEVAEARAWLRNERDLATQSRRLDAIYEEVAP
jgi:glycogen(starch) synthase